MPGRLAGSGVGTDGVTYCNCEINQWPKSSWHFRVRLYFRIENLILLLCRSMRRLMNVIYVMGRLLKAFRHVNLATNLSAPSLPYPVNSSCFSFALFAFPLFTYCTTKYQHENGASDPSSYRASVCLSMAPNLLPLLSIDFSWHHLSTWANITEQWPYRLAHCSHIYKLDYLISCFCNSRKLGP